MIWFWLGLWLIFCLRFLFVHPLFYIILLLAILHVHFIVLQTTYENFRYRADNRPNVYDRGCVNNFMEVFCTRGKPSRNKFRAFVREEAPRPPPTSRSREPEPESASEPRSKVEDDLEIGGELLKISRRRTSGEVDEELGGRNSNGMHSVVSESELVSGLESQLPVSRAEVRNSSWGRRSGSWEISQDVLAKTSPVTGFGATSTQREGGQ